MMFPNRLWLPGHIHRWKAIVYVSRQRKPREKKCINSGDVGRECQVRESFRRYFDVYRDDEDLLTNCGRIWVWLVNEIV